MANILLIVIVTIISIAIILYSIRMLFSTRKRYYEEYMKRKNNG